MKIFRRRKGLCVPYLACKMMWLKARFSALFLFKKLNFFSYRCTEKLNILNPEIRRQMDPFFSFKLNIMTAKPAA